ncbi:putative L,D-transpeptidase YkuD [compost metagenome]
MLLLAMMLIPINRVWHDDKQAVPAIAGSPQEAASVGTLFVPVKELRPIGNAWNAWTSAGAEAPDLTIAARLEEESGWRSWTGRTKLLMTIKRNGSGGRLDVAMLDSQTCVCTPADASAATKLYKEWSQRQETHWTLASAIYQYEKKYKKWPDKLEDLIRPYPNNVLAGEGSGMRDIFGEVLAKQKLLQKQSEAAEPEEEVSTAQGKPAGTKVGTNGYMDEQWGRPMEIIVDRATYRLAVVQGNMIIRSYEVGLGGDETPEGTFYISEKVRNPNGSENGVFGSRGMTLSNTLYAIHGTDEPDSIGKDESLGCIRMGKEDVEELYDLVPLGTVVKIKNGTLPSKAQQQVERFKLEPQQNETNPDKVYQWLT